MRKGVLALDGRKGFGRSRNEVETAWLPGSLFSFLLKNARNRRNRRIALGRSGGSRGFLTFYFSLFFSLFSFHNNGLDLTQLG